jgi:ABC-type uncharacterized transport system auxiliary subunit
VLLLPRNRRSKEAAFFHTMAPKSTSACANIAEALQKRGNFNNVLKAILYWTRKAPNDLFV